MKPPIFHELSPTFIYQSEVHNKEVIKEVFFNNLEKYGFDIEGDNGYIRDKGGQIWTTGESKKGKGFIHLDPEFKVFFDQVKKQLCGFLTDLNFNIDTLSFHIVKSWYTIMNNNAGVNFHIHSASELSFVYYVDVPTGSGNIHFMNPNFNEMSYNSYFTNLFESTKSGGFINEISSEGYNPHTSRCFTLPAIEGNLIIFPSKLPHMVLPSLNTTKKRYSISGDIKLCTNIQIDGYENGLAHPSRWLEL